MELFFSVIIDGLFIAIIVYLFKIFGKKKEKTEQNLKILFILTISFFAFFLFFVITFDKISTEESKDIVEVEKQSEINIEVEQLETKEENEQQTVFEENNEITSSEESLTYDNITLPEKYKQYFIDACYSCNIDATKVKKIEKMSDCGSGERYSFVYNKHSHTAYLLDNGDIDSINYCGDTKVQLYKKGYAPLDINDFEISDISIITSLQNIGKDVVTQYANYPKTLNFDWWTTGTYTRYKDYYIATCEFSCKNAFNVKESHKLRIDCTINDDGIISLQYAQIDSSKVYGEIALPEIERQELEIGSIANTNDIVLEYDKLGEYGQKDLFDGEEYIRYYIPNGKYKVTCETRGSMIWIETVALHKEDGYDTSDIISNVKFSSIDEEYEIDIQDGMCLSLTINSIVHLKLVE